MKKIFPSQRTASLRLEWVLGVLALACGSLACGSAEEGSSSPDGFVPPAPSPEGASPVTPAAPAPVDVAPTEGVPSDVSLDGEPTAEAAGNTIVACTDVPPDALFTCAEQVGWGKCGETWMQNACNASCGRCAPAGGAPTAQDPSPVDQTPLAPLPVLPDGVQPVSPDATPEVRNLLAFLYQEYGVHMLSGQMESTWMEGGAEYELNYIEGLTGKLPAVRGLDFIEYDGVAQRTIEWWERGGIANLRWHWGAPTRGEGYDASQEAVDIDLVLTPGTAEYVSMIEGLDRTAEELAIIRDANVPVLWTPFHELDGNWFWWGKEGPDQFKRLWRFMFEYFTQQKGLTNLIWVLGYTGQPNGDWYPGKEYVDVAGADSYARTEQPQLNIFNAVRNIVGDQMPVAYHENGIIPNPTLARDQGAAWSWFMTWHTSWLTDENTEQQVRGAYESDFVLTLDELPSLR